MSNSSDFLPLIETIQSRYGVSRTTAHRWRREYRQILLPIRASSRRLLVRPCVLPILDRALQTKELAK
jgi:transposase-like protein